MAEQKYYIEEGDLFELFVITRCPECNKDNPCTFSLEQNEDIDTFNEDLEDFKIENYPESKEKCLEIPFEQKCNHCEKNYTYDIEIIAKIKNIRKLGED